MDDQDESAPTGTRPKTKSGISLKLKRCDQGKEAKMSDNIEEKKAEMKARVLQICSIQEKAASIQEMRKMSKEFFKCLAVPNGIWADIINETNLKSAPKTKSMTTHSYAYGSLPNTMSIGIKHTNNEWSRSVFFYARFRFFPPKRIWFAALIPSFHHG